MLRYAFETADNMIGHQSYPDYLDFRARNRCFEDLAAFSMSQVVLDAGNDPARTWTYETSGNYFDVPGTQPYLGRFYHGDDEHGANSARYVVLSYAYWHSHFGDDRGVVGRTVLMNKHLADGDRVPGRNGLDWRDALNNRNLWNGGLFSEQTFQ